MCKSKEREVVQKDSFLVKHDPEGGEPFRAQIVWKNAIGFLVMHVMAVYGFYLMVFEAKFLSWVWVFINIFFIEIGVTIGAHRLWSHRTYKASPGLRLFLTFCFTLCGQNCTYIWARDHRQHHKYSDTAADPHDSTRGFFFSHIGWLMVRKHPAVIAGGKTVDMSDLEADSIVMFQKKYYKTLYAIIALVIPVLTPWYFWNEDIYNSFLVCYMFRYILCLNATWLVNSAAHMYGMHPYNSKIVPAENKFVSMICCGEGWHNYHHTFPWDYRASEFGMGWNLNAELIDWLSRRGWATELRSASKNTVYKKVQAAGDGSHFQWGVRQDIDDAVVDGKTRMRVKEHDRERNSSPSNDLFGVVEGL